MYYLRKLAPTMRKLIHLKVFDFYVRLSELTIKSLTVVNRANNELVVK